MSQIRHLSTLVALETPATLWSTITLDFIAELAATYGHTEVLMLEDHLTKMAHFIPCHYLPSAKTTAQLLVQTVVVFMDFQTT